MGVRVFVWSDVHLEKGPRILEDLLTGFALPCNRENSEHVVRVLVAAGDIAPLRRPDLFAQFVHRVSPLFDHVVVVPGNHEYYGSVYNEANASMERICRHIQNVYLLINDTVDIDGVRFIGSTLWSHLNREDANRVMMMSNDYRQIFDDDGRTVLPTFTNTLHADSVAFISSELEEAAAGGVPCVVCTHYAPLFSMPDIGLFTASAEYLHSPNNALFHSNQDEIFAAHGPEQGTGSLRAWVYGHTHHRARDTYRGVTLFTNQLGYPGELDELGEFNRYAHFDV